VYERCFQGRASNEEIQIVKKASEIIRNGNLPEMAAGASEKLRKEVYANLSGKIRRERNKRKIKKMVAYSISAVAVLAAIFFVNKTVFQDDTLNSPMAATSIRTGDERMKQVELGDGTKITMNQNTRIEYYESTYNRDKREIWLNGEAFFDVAKDARRPFIIHSGNFSIRVLGTSFNVKSYPNLNQYTVSVRRGKVDVRRGKEHLGTLVKNTELAYDIKANTFEITDKDCSEIDKWTAGKLVLNNADADELTFRMKQYYGIDLKISGKALSGVMINGIYDKTDTPEDVIRSICVLYNIKYTYRDGVITVLPSNE